MVEIDVQRMQELFEELGLLDPETHGYTWEIVAKRDPAPAAPADAVSSELVAYYDSEGKPVAEAHQYTRLDGTLTASGKPDPKRIWHNGNRYELPA